jgi:hypothetical protein
MVKRMSRVAWTLAGFLAVSVLGGGAALSARYLPVANAEILPPGSWRFGTYPFYGAACMRGRASVPLLAGYTHCYGFFAVRVWR